MSELREILVKRNRVFEGKVITVEENTVELPNGNTATREVVYHKGAVCVIAIVDEYMYFVKQFRFAPDEILLEIPAGKIEVGEAPEVTAEKELKEEIGGVARDIKKLHEFYVSPGFSNELVYLYEASGITLESQALEDDEFLELEKIHVSKLSELLKSGRVRDAKTIVAIQHVLMHHS